MSARPSACVASVTALCLLAPMSSQGGQDGAYEPGRTEWGDPDLRGHYLPGPIQPLETRASDAWQPPEGANLGQGAAFNRFFEPDPDAPQRGRVATPMVVDPPDGRIPFQPWAAEQRGEIMARQDELEHLDPRVKCLPSALPRAHLPVSYNTYQILQIPGFVVMLYEWNHLYRYIPLDGRPHVDADIRLGMGDSRGHWEGNTLVVDTTNFSNKTHFFGSFGGRHVVERFTRVDADTINYEFTVEDPMTWTQPWSVAYPLRSLQSHVGGVDGITDAQVYEYACHEGNYGLTGQLAGSRAVEKASAQATRQQ